MAKPEKARLQEHIVAWFEHLSGDVRFKESAFRDMENQDVDYPAVMSALEDSVFSTAAKEKANDLFFNVIGKTCDDDTLSLTISCDPLEGVSVHKIIRM